MRVYLGTFLLAFAMLALEITFTRVISVAAWYHLAFFAIATAMLGMTAGATMVYVRPERFTKETFSENLTKSCISFALVVPIALIVLCLVPLTAFMTVMSIFAMLLVTGACSVPFYFAGIAITLILTKCDLPIGKLYAADLAGASFGCLFVLAGLEVIDAPSLILLCGAIGALAGFVFACGQVSGRRTAWSLATVMGMVLMAAANTSSPRLIRPLIAKGEVRRPYTHLLERWNSFSRITVHPAVHGKALLWGGSPTAPDKPVLKHDMEIDGGAGTTVSRFHSNEEIEHLRFDVTNLAYHVRPRGNACIIGVGGGRDLQAALLFGHEHVTGVDVNPIFIDVLEGPLREFAGLAGRDDVTLVVDEARSHLSRSDDKYSLIQMSLIDTWAATGAGAFALSENSLYTVEAWQVFLSRLKDDGIFTVSRWYCKSDLGETGRLVGLATAALLRTGADEPSKHLALVTCGRISTLLVSRKPFRADDLARIEDVCRQMKFSVAALPGRLPEHQTLREILAVRSVDELYRVAENKPLRCDPPTDEDPYFFNMLRLGHLHTVGQGEGGVMRGNTKAVVTLVGLVVSLFVLTLATILVPLLLRERKRDGAREPGVLWAGAIYFSAIGAGFMLMEIALIQRLSVLLSHPVYALGILLFTMILSTGVGSLLSERLPLGRAPWVFLYPVTAVAAILGVRFLLSALLANMITSTMTVKILTSVVVIFPLGIVMGLFFPTGMRLVRAIRPAETPWYWALNGIFGVLSSAMAVLISIFLGISLNFYIAAGCYTLVLLCVWSLHRRIVRQAAEQTQEPPTAETGPPAPHRPPHRRHAAQGAPVPSSTEN